MRDIILRISLTGWISEAGKFRVPLVPEFLFA